MIPINIEKMLAYSSRAVYLLVDESQLYLNNSHMNEVLSFGEMNDDFCIY